MKIIYLEYSFAQTHGSSIAVHIITYFFLFLFKSISDVNGFITAPYTFSRSKMPQLAVFMLNVASPSP